MVDVDLTPGDVDNPAFRRQLRLNYRALQAESTREKDELVQPESGALGAMLKRADELAKHVKKPREQAVDSELLCTLADFGVEMSKKLGPTGAAAFSARAFVSRLCAAHVNGWDPSSQAVDDPGSFDWNVFGSAVSKHFVHAPTMGFMNGVMDTQVKERKMAQRRSRTETGPVANPDAVASTLVEQQTDHAMKKMIKAIKKKKNDGEAVKVDQLVSNSKSFAQFVENAFTLSFLVKDGDVGLVPGGGGDKDACPTVAKKHKPEEQDVERSTFVLHLDMKGWRALNDANGGLDGILPHREETKEQEVTAMEGARDSGGRVENVVDQENLMVGAKPRKPSLGSKRPRDSTNS